MKNTDIKNRNLVIYSVYIRNHTEEGTFASLEKDLGRIKKLGVDVIWLMPIHPVGQKGKKGSLGSVYSISDYRTVNPDYGTLEDFRHLVNEIHKNNMLCIIDVVYNHTSQDSVLVKNKPEFFWKKPDGSFGNRFGEWTDVYDLDYKNHALWEYQAETLKYWATIVDGFRCDVASMVNLEFWQYAVNEVQKVNKNCFWLAETVFYEMVVQMRKQGVSIWSDAELYNVFDAEYQYDIYQKFIDYFSSTGSLENYLEALNYQECCFPENYLKLRFVENHDTLRFAKICPDFQRRMQWLKFMFFQKGPMLIYGGQEFSCTEKPSLFEKDVFVRTTSDACNEKIDNSKLKNNLYDISSFIEKFSKMKKELPYNAIFESHIVSETEKGFVVRASYTEKGRICAEEEFIL